MHMILASQSPRRRELLERMGLAHFDVIPAKGEECANPAFTPAQLVEELSRQKAAEIAASHPDALVIAADTVVSVDGAVLGKPRDRDDAVRMLTLLSGREHTVYSGLTVCRQGRYVTGHEATLVRFRPLSHEDISHYVSTGEPMDKAGAYGIQGYWWRGSREITIMSWGCRCAASARFWPVLEWTRWPWPLKRSFKP